MKLKFQYGSNGPIGRQLAAWQNSLFPGYVSFRRLQFHHQNRLIISLINKGANTWIITQPPYSHNFCRSKTAINNRELLYLSLHTIAITSIIVYFIPMHQSQLKKEHSNVKRVHHMKYTLQNLKASHYL